MTPQQREAHVQILRNLRQAYWMDGMEDERAAFDAAIAALLPHDGAGEWQDIASAPKDGTYVLAYRLNLYSMDHTFVAAFDGVHQCWNEGGFDTATPTHWQPLPAPPLAAAPPTPAAEQPVME